MSKAQADVQQPQNGLAYWKGELQFAKALASLELKLKSAEEVELSKLDEVDAAKEKLAAAQAIVQQAQQKREDFKKQVEAIEQQIQALKNN